MKRILHLTLHKEWFDLINSGQKTEEFRSNTPYWNKRLDGKTFDEIHFRNGYAKNARKMVVEWKGVKGKYAIQLGKVISRNF